MISLFPKTHFLASEALDMIGRHRFPDQWTGGELNARRLPDPGKAKAAKKQIAEKPTNPNPLSEILGFVVSEDDVLRWPDPDSDDYKTERDAHKRHMATFRDLVAALHYDHVDSWLITDSHKRIDIRAHEWERPMRFSVGAFMDAATRQLLKRDLDTAIENPPTGENLLTGRWVDRRLTGKLYVDRIALEAQLSDHCETGEERGLTRSGKTDIHHHFDKITTKMKLTFERGEQARIARQISKLTGYKPNTIEKAIRPQYKELKAKLKAD